MMIEVANGYKLVYDEKSDKFFCLCGDQTSKYRISLVLNFHSFIVPERETILQKH